MKFVLIFALCAVITAFTDEQDKAFGKLLDEIIGKGKETSRDETMPEDDLLTLAQRYNAFIDNVEQQEKREEEMKDLSSLTNVYNKLEEKHDEGMDELTKLTNQYNDYIEQQQKQNNLPTMIKQYNDFVDNHQTVQEDVPVNLNDYDLVPGSPGNSPCPNGIYLSVKQMWACVKNVPEPPPKTYKVYGPPDQNPCVINGGVWDPAGHVWICNAVNEDAPVNNNVNNGVNDYKKKTVQEDSPLKLDGYDLVAERPDKNPCPERDGIFLSTKQMWACRKILTPEPQPKTYKIPGPPVPSPCLNGGHYDYEEKVHICRLSPIKQLDSPHRNMREKIEDDIRNDDMTSVKKDFEIIEDAFNRKLSHEEKMDILREVVTDDFVRKYKMEKDSA